MPTQKNGTWCCISFVACMFAALCCVIYQLAAENWIVITLCLHKVEVVWPRKCSVFLFQAGKRGVLRLFHTSTWKWIQCASDPIEFTYLCVCVCVICFVWVYVFVIACGLLCRLVSKYLKWTALLFIANRWKLCDGHTFSNSWHYTFTLERQDGCWMDRRGIYRTFEFSALTTFVSISQQIADRNAASSFPLVSLLILVTPPFLSGCSECRCTSRKTRRQREF